MLNNTLFGVSLRRHPIFSEFTHFLKKYVIMFVTKFDFLRLTYERKGGDDKYGLRKAI